MGHRPEFGFNFDPSHLLWQFVDPVAVHPGTSPTGSTTSTSRTPRGRSTASPASSARTSNFGDPRRGWDFRSPGRGQVDFEEIARALNAIGYQGPLSVEWEDPGMDREYGAAEAAKFVKERMSFIASGRGFDSASAEAQAH